MALRGDMKRLLLSLLLLTAFAPAVVTHATPPAALRRETLDIYFIDVEGGQSTLLVTPENESFLIDAGFPGTGTFASLPVETRDARDPNRILAAARDAGIQRIDHLMLTHYHADHAGGVPELARLIPIGEYIDHAGPSPEAESGVPGTQAVYDRYVKQRGSSPHVDPKPGDRLAIKGIDATVVSSFGLTTEKPVAGAGTAAGSCSAPALPAQEKLENPHSLGVLVQFGAFRFLDVGDLSGAPLHALTCPTNMIGTADVYLVAHHGGVDAAGAAMFASVKPRVAVVNNGAAKGGAAETLAMIQSMAGTDGWQLHRATAAAAPNAPDARIANLDETTSAWIKISARRDGSFTVTNGRTGAATSYPPRAARLMGAADLASLSAGPPTHRIAYGPSPLQFVNLRLPAAKGPHPVILFIHGGCWLSQYDIAHAGALEQALADSGYAVWSVEYRRIGDDGGGWPNTYTDIAKAADKLRDVAPQYQLDLNRVIAAGHSAGGAFALWLAARGKIAPQSELYAKNPLKVRAVFALAPAPDLEQLQASGVCGNVIDKLMGGSPAQHADRYDAASLMRLAPVGVPQTLVIGMRDQSWGPIGRSYFARTQAVGDTAAHVVELPESGHFEMINPRSSSWPAVVRALRAAAGDAAPKH